MHPQQQQQAHHTHHVAPTAGTPPATPAISREAAIAASERAQNSGILKLRGLPFSCTKQDVTQFFEGKKMKGKEGSVSMYVWMYGSLDLRYQHFLVTN
jgi:hypothetical protein